MEKQSSSFDFSSLNLIVYVIRRFRFLAAITLLAAIVSVVVALSITPLYKSQVVLFPASSVSVSQVLLTNTPSNRGGILTFGDESEAEQILQVLNSDEIRDRIIAKYDLMEHYEIDTSSRIKKTMVYDAFKGKIKFRRTEFNSIEISVLDKDPEIASDIANDISFLLDSIMHRVKRERALKGLAIVEKEYQEVQKNVKQMEDSLNTLRNQGVVLYELQTERFTEGYATALVENNQRAAEILDNRLKTMGKLGTKYNSIRQRLDYEYGLLSTLKQKYMQAQVEADQSLPVKFVVDTAYPAERKSYPTRSLIVIVSTLSAFIFALLAALVFDNLKAFLSKPQSA